MWRGDKLKMKYHRNVIKEIRLYVRNMKRCWKNLQNGSVPEWGWISGQGQKGEDLWDDKVTGYYGKYTGSSDSYWQYKAC
ncbi:hypothetical protein SAMN05216286_3894 [Kosakonia oryzae]|uniref:Uncharacterized protein n=1 Tax=Kosakonia oryzae TaxID=497725 RepID=A0AA94H6Q1_9ENTR|nr:hypothetical protein SAMN05216286_3894 [Kosakonia oryzae]